MKLLIATHGTSHPEGSESKLRAGLDTGYAIADKSGRRLVSFVTWEPCRSQALLVTGHVLSTLPQRRSYTPTK